MHREAQHQPHHARGMHAASFCNILKRIGPRPAVSMTMFLPAAGYALADLAAAPIAGAHLAKQGKVAAGAAAGGRRFSRWRLTRHLLHLTVIPAAVMLGTCPQASGDQPAGGHELDRCLQLLHSLGMSAHSIPTFNQPPAAEGVQKVSEDICSISSATLAGQRYL